MYYELFEKMGLDRGNLWLYEGSYFQAFSITAIHLYGYVNLMISIGKIMDMQDVRSQFLVVPYKSVYNCILGREFVTSHLGRCGLTRPSQAQI